MKATVHGAATVEAASRRFVPRIEPQDDRSNAARRRVYSPANGYEKSRCASAFL